MNTIEKFLTTRDRLGNTTRGYKIYILPKVKGKKVLTLPCKGHLPLTGEDAIKAMTSYAKKGFKTIAETETFGEIEQLSLREMREVVI